ncbi:hypothetical protein BN2476_960001 [Paraburkholderia piptadeniae]|uniref:Uncharacterized protein n=1 Tax=Paraburkholderia piptadeniae TaxID=1701573 RepID=A0A1N7SU02_9BURK|nr:hypothetical protein BN2476_960001 [Paraburkholderia piptadeniae]
MQSQPPLEYRPHVLVGPGHTKSIDCVSECTVKCIQSVDGCRYLNVALPTDYVIHIHLLSNTEAADQRLLLAEPYVTRDISLFGLREHPTNLRKRPAMSP